MKKKEKKEKEKGERVKAGERDGLCISSLLCANVCECV